MKKTLLLLLFIGQILATEIAREGLYIFDSKREFLSIFLKQNLIVDHVGKYGYELYGPKGLSKFVKSLNIDFIRIDEEHVHDKNEFVVNFPPTNFVYSRIHSIVSENPDIFKIISLGKSVEGKDILAIKVSDNVNTDEIEPEFKYISNMHGNEIVGRELLVFLLEDMAKEYRANNESVVQLINNTEIFLIPTMNPDGSDRRRRGNSNHVDLNRNFPDFSTQDNRNTPDNRQLETQAIMKFQAQRKFALSANFHGGTKCVNYPWDTAAEQAPLTPLIIELSKEYASKVPGMYDSDEFQDGIVNGYQWYEVNGGMQDWSYHWYNDLQVTIELSHQKWPDYSSVKTYFDDNKWSLYRYIERIHQGLGIKFLESDISGTVKVTQVQGLYKNEIGTYGFGQSEFYKVVPEGLYELQVTLKDGRTFSVMQEVSFEVHENGNYHVIDL